MENLIKKYCQNMISDDINELLESILTMRFNLKDEFEFMIFIRNFCLENKEKLNQRILEITNKIESIILREIERISDLVYHIQKNLYFNINQTLFSKYQFIRGNYNKILINIQKVSESSQLLLELRSRFEENKSFLSEKSNKLKESESKNEKSEKNEFSILVDISHDLDNIILKKKKSNAKSPNKIKKSNSLRKKKSVSKSIEKKRDVSFTKTKSKHLLSLQINENKLSFEKVNFIKNEIGLVYNFLDEIKTNIENKCIDYKEKENYNKIQSQIIKASSIIESLKENIVNFKYSLKSLLSSLDSLEKENKKLRTDNNNLTLYAKTKKIKSEKNINEEGEENIKLSSISLNDNSLFQNSSIELNMNMKNNLIDGNKKRVFISK